uniref:Ig-like domain-containing protein n=1 Tax=Dicentrarchus labrax TaxID=13489 RepID=A0A8C4ICC6_DICLA
MQRSALIILTLNSFCALSQIPHEVLYFVGCFINGTTEVQFEFDNEEILHVDLQKEDIEYTVPRLIDLDQSHIFEGFSVLSEAFSSKDICLTLNKGVASEFKNPPEEKEEFEPGVENGLTCFVNHFYPPDIKVSWTKNGRPVSEGVSLSCYYPNNDQTFYQFSTLTFTPMEGDMYSCTVEHSALDSPKTRIWEPESTPPGLGPDIFCGVGLTVGLVGVAVGTFLMVKGHHRQ